MEKIYTIVTNTIDDREADRAKDVYVDSAEQALTYEPVPDYARVVAELIASAHPRRVLEFGCSAGRNLKLLEARIPNSTLVGVDVNPRAIEMGRALHGLELTLADENWIAGQPDDAFDVSFTVSVIDHMPYPETTLRHLLRISRKFLILFELEHHRLGKATHNVLFDGDSVRLQSAYRYSYIHDYRFELERKLGAHCIADLKYPIGREDLRDLYRLYVFSKDHSFGSKPAIATITLSDL